MCDESGDICDEKGLRGIWETGTLAVGMLLEYFIHETTPLIIL